MTKYGRPRLGGAGVEHPGDVGMIHQRQRLPLGFKRAITSRVSIPSLMTLIAVCAGVAFAGVPPVRAG